MTGVVMPGATGRELAVELFARGSCDRVLYFSGYTADELRRREIAQDHGALLLRKPFTELQLRSRVRNALRVRPHRR